MQNYEVVVIDEKLLRALGDIKSEPSAEFIRENYQRDRSHNKGGLF